jgi:hypothetical protein
LRVDVNSMEFLNQLNHNQLLDEDPVSWSQDLSRLLDTIVDVSSVIREHVGLNILYRKSSASVKLPDHFHTFLPVPLVAFILRSDDTQVFILSRLLKQELIYRSVHNDICRCSTTLLELWQAQVRYVEPTSIPTSQYFEDVRSLRANIRQTEPNRLF